MPDCPEDFPGKVLFWAEERFDVLAFLNSNHYSQDPYASIPWVFALGVHDEYVAGSGPVFDTLKSFVDLRQDWLFGFFSYEIKNQLERLHSVNPDHIGMPLCHFFQPQVLILCDGHSLQVGVMPGVAGLGSPAGVLESIRQHKSRPGSAAGGINEHRARVSRQRYLQQLQAIKDHIQAGDIYEMNYCVEFYSEGAALDPVRTYESLNGMSEAPFSCFYKVDGKYLMGASPERFMKKLGSKLVSQPMKGTSPRGASAGEDMRLRQALFGDEKERSENVMIVDLVRNDLSRTAQKDSVRVEELFGVYPFRQVNQMISTVVSQLSPASHPLDAIRHAFPMGSMTGAPKIRAMQLIDEFEDTARGLYSGAVGYFSPNMDFDFNVVIRSILYNSRAQYLSFMAGSAITSGSDPEKEYAECLLKARAMAHAIRS